MKKAKTILIFNNKGGVGKSTITAILASSFSAAVCFNISLGQPSEDINSAPTFDLINLINEDESTTALETLNFLQEDEDIDYVFIDTPGELTEEFVEIINEVDYFIIPFVGGRRDMQDTIKGINAVFDSGIIDSNKSNICLIHNKYTEEPKVIATCTEYEKEINLLNLDHELNISFSKLSNSKTITTMEEKSKSIQELESTNKLAYRVFRKRVDSLVTDVKKFIGEGV